MGQQRNHRLAQAALARIALGFQRDFFHVLGNPAGDIGDRRSIVALRQLTRSCSSSSDTLRKLLRSRTITRAVLHDIEPDAAEKVGAGQIL